MSTDHGIVAGLAFAQSELATYARKLARAPRDPSARQLAELARLKAAVQEAKSRL